MTDDFQTLDVNQVKQTLGRLHEQVCNGKVRIEVKRPGCEETCIIISKTELEALERALEILADTEAAHAMEGLIQRLADASDGTARTRRMMLFS